MEIRDKKSFVCQGIMILMICLAMFILFGSNVLAGTPRANESYVNDKTILRKEWDDQGHEEDRPEYVAITVGMIDPDEYNTRRATNSNAPVNDLIDDYTVLISAPDWELDLSGEFPDLKYWPNSANEEAVEGYRGLKLKEEKPDGSSEYIIAFKNIWDKKDDPDDPGTDPDEPNDPGNPDDPEEPVTPGEDPGEPDDPETPEDPDVPGEEDPDKPEEDEKPEDPETPDKPDTPSNPGGSGGTGGSGGGGGSTPGRPGYVFEDPKDMDSEGPSETQKTVTEDLTPGYIPPHPEYNKIPVMGSDILGPGYVGDKKLTEADGAFSTLPGTATADAASDSLDGGNDVTGTSDTKAIIPELSELYAKNNDLLGWLTVPGTGNGYPVMNDPDVPTYYWHHTFDRQYSDVGVPFTAPFCTPDSDNILIHGHNMNGTLQFGNIWNYREKSFRDRHPVIDFKTIHDSEGSYEVMAIFFAPIYPEEQTGVFKWYQYAGDMNRAQFEYYVDNVKAMSLYDTGVTAEYGDRLITLETCANTHDSTRLVVVARKKTGTI